MREYTNKIYAAWEYKEIKGKSFACWVKGRVDIVDTHGRFDVLQLDHKEWG